MTGKQLYVLNPYTHLSNISHSGLIEPRGRRVVKDMRLHSHLLRYWDQDVNSLILEAPSPILSTSPERGQHNPPLCPLFSGQIVKNGIYFLLHLCGQEVYFWETNFPASCYSSSQPLAASPLGPQWGHLHLKPCSLMIFIASHGSAERLEEASLFTQNTHMSLHRHKLVSQCQN